MAETSAGTILDQQDPLPESNWLYRRLFTAALLVILCVFRGWETYHGRHEVWTDIMILVVICFYMIAPSGEQVIRGMQQVSLFKSGAQIKTTKMVQETDDATVTSSTTQVNTDGQQTGVDNDPAGNLPAAGGGVLSVPSTDAPFVRNRDTGSRDSSVTDTGAARTPRASRGTGAGLGKSRKR